MSLTCPTCHTSHPDGTSVCPHDDSSLLPNAGPTRSETALEPGTMIGEQRVEEKLGEGSSGAVTDIQPASVEPIVATARAAGTSTIRIAVDKAAEMEVDPIAPTLGPDSLVRELSPPKTLASPHPGTVPADKPLPEIKIVGTDAGARATLPPRGKSAAGPSKNIVLAGIAALALGSVLGVLLFHPKDDASDKPARTSAQSASVQSITPEPSTMTLRLKVMPSDARVIVDGRDLGGAGDAIVLPREKKKRAVRIEKSGYVSQTIWITTNTDQELGPISLKALAPAPAPSASVMKPALASSKPATTKSKSK